MASPPLNMTHEYMDKNIWAFGLYEDPELVIIPACCKYLLKLSGGVNV